MYYIRFDDPSNRRIQPWDAVMMVAHSTARVAMLASTQPRFDVTKDLFWKECGNCMPIPTELDSPHFPDWLKKYWQNYKKWPLTLTVGLPTGKLFLEDVRINISDLISAVLEKEDRLVFLCDEIDGLMFSSKQIKPAPFEFLSLLGMRPSRKGFFDEKPPSRYHFVPNLCFTCDKEVIYPLRRAFADPNLEEVKRLVNNCSLTDDTVGGLVATMCYSLMLSGGFSIRQESEVDEMLQYLVDQGADVNCRTKEEGNTVLHLLAACFGAHQNACFLVQMLKRHGADIRMKNDRGDTPFFTSRNHLQYKLLGDALYPQNHL